MVLIILAIGAYLFGSIPIGIIVGWAFGFDPRKVGSGNIGMTNVARAGGIGPALATFIGDLLKGFVPVAGARWLGLTPGQTALVGGAAITGAVSSVFLRFRGGKGISTSLGIWLGLSPIVALILIAVFGIVLTPRRIVSLASLAAAIALVPVVAIVCSERPYLLLAIFMSAVVIIRHRKNIERLIHGREHPFSTLRRNEVSKGRWWP